MRADADWTRLDAACSADQGAVATTPAPRPSKGPKAAESSKADLLAFLRVHTPTEAAQVLGLSRATVYRLRDGYWPADPSAILEAWAAHRARTTALATSWFLRRVQPGGVLRLGRTFYGNRSLVARAGQLVAVARAASGDLLAQTLDLAPVRLPLVQSEIKEIEHA